MKEFIVDNLTEAKDVLEEFMSQSENIESISSVAGILLQTIKSGGKIISCGNGGSMTDAMHFAEELTGRYRYDRMALPAISISDPSHMTCTANDFGFDVIFSRFIEGIGQAGDTLLTLSTSGNSMNVVKAAEAAREKKMTVVGLTGKTGGLLSGLLDAEVRVKGGAHADRIQEMHIKILHILVLLIEEGIK